MAEGKVAVCVGNAFVRAAVEAAVRAVGGQPVGVGSPGQAQRVQARALVVELTGQVSPSELASLAQSQLPVLAFAPAEETSLLALARQAGALALPRSLFLRQLPQILLAALGSYEPR